MMCYLNNNHEQITSVEQVRLLLRMKLHLDIFLFTCANFLSKAHLVYYYVPYYYCTPLPFLCGSTVYGYIWGMLNSVIVYVIPLCDTVI